MATPNIPNWQARLLQGLGAPVTSENVRFLNAWAQAEGGSAENNPFNTTEPGHGSIGSYNSVGVQRYSTPQGGIQATIDTLQNGRYGGILSALKQGTSAMADAQAEAATPWGTGSLIEKVLGGRVTGGQPTTQGNHGGAGEPVSRGYTVIQPPDHRQHIVAQKVDLLGHSLAAELLAQTATLSSGGAPNLKNLFTLAKGYQGARKAAGPAPLGGTALAQQAGKYQAQVQNL